MAHIEKRMRENGKPAYTATVRVRGFPTKCATFDKHSEARDWANTLESDMRAGRYGADVVARKRTADEMIQRYIDTVLESKSTKAGFIAAQRQQLTWWQARLKGLRLINLTPFIINECKEDLAGPNFSRRKPGTVNRYLMAFNHVVETAIREWGWLSVNPMKKITKPKEPRGRVRCLSDDERNALMRACAKEEKKPLLLIVLLALCTGARKGEILSLKRKDVYLDRLMAVAHETKNGEARQLYFWAGLADMLREWIAQPHPKSALLFPTRGGKTRMCIEAEWRRALRRANIEDFRFHDLRHTSASYMAMTGGEMMAIAEALGHKDLKMVKRYSHLSKGHVAEMVTSMNQKMLGEGLNQ